MTDKVIRTPREWTETCPECKGSGHVKRRDHFSLWTQDEHEPHKSEFIGHDVPPDVYKCTVMGGANITASCREGVSIANLVNKTVVFVFNNILVACGPGADPGTVLGEYWQQVNRMTKSEEGRK